jgi:hypothetical protein
VRCALSEPKSSTDDYSLAPTWQDRDLVFPNDDGGFLNSRLCEYQFKRLLARANLPPIFTPPTA